jgi:hypothetical protein
MRLVQSSIALSFCSDNSFLDRMKYLVLQHLGMVKRKAESYLWHVVNVNDNSMD